MKGNISIEMLRHLRKGVKGLPSGTFGLMKSYILSRMEESSAFMGKVPGDDLYYTAFGWLLASVFGARPNRRMMRSYLSSIDPDSLDLIHYAAFVKCSLIARTGGGKMATLLRAALSSIPARETDSFSRFPGDDRESPYSQFMLLNISQDCFRQVPGPTQVLSALENYACGENTFSGVKGGVVPTVQATCCALVIKGYLEGFKKENASGLLEMQSENGGFKANPSAPVPNLLSTAVALFTLSLHGLKPAYGAFDFIDAHLLDDGCFSPTVLDSEGDIEYLFYGLLALGSL